MFFELHEENRIGYKKLSDADLGISARSHQTHIGLSEGVLTFLPDRDQINEDSIFVYEDKFEYIDDHFDRIKTTKDTYRSPKTRMGDRGGISIVSAIRAIVKSYEVQTDWFLVWFGLKNKKIVYYLFNKNSADYQNIGLAGINLNTIGAHHLKRTTQNAGTFDRLVKYIEEKINRNGLGVLEELEVEAQTQNVQPNKKYVEYDIEKANRVFKETGYMGEKLVARYLLSQKENGKIENYVWCNEDEESGLPYDFRVQDCYANVLYFDVKTTGYKFNQKMIFSTQEIDFIANTVNNYCVYRVYKKENGKYALRICENCKEMSQAISSYTSQYNENLSQISVSLQTAKLAISPEIDLLEFKKEIPI